MATQMAKTTDHKPRRDKMEVEAGAEKRLANILKRALNTPPQHQASTARSEKPKKAK